VSLRGRLYLRVSTKPRKAKPGEPPEAVEGRADHRESARAFGAARTRARLRASARRPASVAALPKLDLWLLGRCQSSRLVQPDSGRALLRAADIAKLLAARFEARRQRAPTTGPLNA
jgi:hypothetical protein